MHPFTRLLRAFAQTPSARRCMHPLCVPLHTPSLRAVARPPLPAVARPRLCVLLHAPLSACRCTLPLCMPLHALPASPLRAVACPPAPPGLSSACRCTPSPLRAIARPSMRRRIVHARVWGDGEGSCSRNRTVLRVTVTLLRCYGAPVMSRGVPVPLTVRGTVFSGTGRGVTHGTRGLPVSRPIYLHSDQVLLYRSDLRMSVNTCQISDRLSDL